MSKLATVVTVAEPKWLPPKVEVGDIVLWSDRGEAHVCPAFVMKVGAAGSLTLSLHIDGMKDHVFRSGVRHQDDPWIQKSPEHSAGVWRLRLRDIAINELIRLAPVPLLEEEE